MTSLMHQIIAWFGWGDGIGALAGISAILTLAAILAPVAAGMLLYGLERLQIIAIGKFNRDFAYFFVNFITFPGTFVHEMAHLIFAVITGAEVHEICMFESGEGRLGHISYRNRGTWFIKAVQETLISVAPTVVCVFLGYIFLRMIFSGAYSTGVNIGLWYLVVSLVDHATMSDVDLKGYFSGVWIFIVPLFVFFMVFGHIA
ncbi:MAG: hypothetical protein IK114_08895 [Fibrobacter sp.]|nr:hypothetical protein [Fibrobacter sp.]